MCSRLNAFLPHPLRLTGGGENETALTSEIQLLFATYLFDSHFQGGYLTMWWAKRPSYLPFLPQLPVPRLMMY